MPEALPPGAYYGPPQPPSLPPPPARELDLAEKRMLLWAELIEQIHDPPSGDPIIRAGWLALADVVDRAPELSVAISSWLDRQSMKWHRFDPAGRPVSQIAGNLRAHLQYDRLERVRGFRGHADPRVYGRGLLRLSRSVDRMAEFTVVQGFPLNTSNGERYGPAEVLRQLMSTSAEPQVDMWDGGPSILLGVNQIALKSRHPFAVPTLLLRASEVDGAGNTVYSTEDAELQDAYRELLAAPDVPGGFLSTGLFRPQDPAVIKMARAAMRPVSEIMNPAFMRRFWSLAGYKLPPEKVSFRTGDITDIENMHAIKALYPHRRFRLAFLGTVVNQLGEDAIVPAIEAAMEMLDDDYPDAAVAIADFAYPDLNDPSRVRLHSRWSQGTYSLLLIYKHDPERRVRVIFRFLTSRPTEVIVGSDEIMVDGAYMSVREALLRRRRLLRGT